MCVCVCVCATMKLVSHPAALQKRALQSVPAPPPGSEFTCSNGEEPFTVDWSGVEIQDGVLNQIVTLNNGFNVELTVTATGKAQVHKFRQTSNGDLDYAVKTIAETADIISPDGSITDPAYPISYITLAIKFENELHGLSVSIGDIDSHANSADVTRIRMTNGLDEPQPVHVTATGTITVKDDYAFQATSGVSSPNPGYDASMYGTAQTPVQTIFLDQAVYVFSANQANKQNPGFNRSCFPALVFKYCAPPVAPTPPPVPTPNSCVPSVPVGETETFEEGTPSSNGAGWTDATVDKSGSAFGQFLGRYGKDVPQPTKVFTGIPTDADSVTVKFKFYEIDSWDATRSGNQDSLAISINDNQFTIGYFDFTEDESSLEGEDTVTGVTWVTEAVGDPSPIGFSSWNDQVHIVTVNVPKDQYTDGSMKLGLHVNLNQGVTDESAGFDDFEVIANYDCSIDRSTPGVNGDPLIMGLSGQLFKFDGRSGAWYSAVSSPSFQWNMKIQEYDGCPAESNKFVSGVGFTLFKKSGLGSPVPAHKIVVNVVNEYGVKTGCGTEATNCLGNGSLEIFIDDKKYVYPGDYQFKDNSGRVIAFNTYYECARKWYDFDITPATDTATALRANRRLDSFPGVFDVVRGLEDTMVDKQACDSWISERQERNDLFHQSGEWSTIIVKTDSISFHVEYKQEHRRCNAHTVDVWISSVSPALYDEEWEGIIGETKDPANHGNEKVERLEFLKHTEDEAYEVNSPFSNKCAGCYLH